MSKVSRRPMYYELVNLTSGNRIGDYGAEEALLGDVHYLVRLRGAAAIAGIGFGQVDARGQRKILAVGKELLALADALPP